MNGEGPDPSILPVGVLGVVAPMNSLGFTPHPGLGLVYDSAIVLLPAETMVFTFQQRRAALRARELAYDEAVRRPHVRVFRLDDLQHVELVKVFTGYRLLLDHRGEKQLRWVVQHESLDELRSSLGKLLGDRFVDHTRE